MALDLGLGLVFSDVSTPLACRCLRAPYLVHYGIFSPARPSDMWSGRLCYTSGTSDPWRFGRKVVVEKAGSSLGEAITETHLHVGKTYGLSTELFDWELSSCEGFLTRGSNED